MFLTLASVLREAPDSTTLYDFGELRAEAGAVSMCVARVMAQSTEFGGLVLLSLGGSGGGGSDRRFLVRLSVFRAFSNSTSVRGK